METLGDPSQLQRLTQGPWWSFLPIIDFSSVITVVQYDVTVVWPVLLGD
jgi:hypothetical protein